MLTIGYLMVEAYAAEVITNDGRTLPANVVGYDNETGFGLLQAISPLKVKPLAFGKSADVKERDGVVVASFGGPDRAARALVVAKREFAGNWEYMLDEAIFTAPPHPQWSGAALISREGKLVGVGSLRSERRHRPRRQRPRQHVRADRPVAADPRRSDRGRPRRRTRRVPGSASTPMEVHGRLMVGRVTPESPAEKAGIQRGDIILGVDGASHRARSPISTARSGRWARPARPFRSTFCRTTRSGAST